MLTLSGMGCYVTIKSRGLSVTIKTNKLELSSAKLRRLMKLSWKKFDEMIFQEVVLLNT